MSPLIDMLVQDWDVAVVLWVARLAKAHSSAYCSASTRLLSGVSYFVFSSFSYRLWAQHRGGSGLRCLAAGQVTTLKRFITCVRCFWFDARPGGLWIKVERHSFGRSCRSMSSVLSTVCWCFLGYGRRSSGLLGGREISVGFEVSEDAFLHILGRVPHRAFWPRRNLCIVAVIWRVYDSLQRLRLNKLTSLCVRAAFDV